MGITILRRGSPVVMTMEVSDAVRGSVAGSVHGGILATFADLACANSLAGAWGSDVEMPVTTDMHIRYYRQPRSGPLKAKATLVHRGRRLLSSECTITDAGDRVLVRATATYMIVPGQLPSEVRQPEVAMD
jgi:uncharacterized protein (TIGR00369 family)